MPAERVPDERDSPALGLQQALGNRAMGRVAASPMPDAGGQRVVLSPLMKAYLLGKHIQATALAREGLGEGHPLPESARSDAQQYLGIDASAVRVHTDRAAHERAAALGANAFAVGNDIVMGAGQYQPENASGRRLLQHELTHVAQFQSGALPGREATMEAQARSSQPTAATHARSAAAPAAQVLRDGPTVTGVVVTLPDHVTFYGSWGPISANIHLIQDLDPAETYSIRYLPEQDQFLIKPGPDALLVEVTLTVKGTDTQIQQGINRYKAYLGAMTQPVALQVKKGGSGSGGGQGGEGEGKGGDPNAPKQQDQGTKGGAKTDQQTKEGGTGDPNQKAPPGPPGGFGGEQGGDPSGSPLPNQPDTKGPTVKLDNIAQLEELKKRGMIPVKDADKIKDKLQKGETLTFEEAAALLDALNKVIAPPDPNAPKDDKPKASWLEWAKFIKENQNLFSGAQMKQGEKGLKPDDVKAILKKHHEYVGATVATVKLSDKIKQAEYDPDVRKSWNSIADWERDLWTAYQNKYGGDVESSRKDLRITDEDKFWMALRMSPQYMDEGIREAASAMFNDPLFIGSTIVGIMAYLALWIMPEPIFSKAVAVMQTIALVSMVAFATSELINLAEAWMDLSDDSKRARKLSELEAAAEKFGKRMGGTELRILLALAMIVGGKMLPTSKPMTMPPGGGGGMELAPAGPPGMAPPPPPVAVTGEVAVGTVKVVNGVIVIAGPGSGLAMTSMKAKGTGGGSTGTSGGGSGPGTTEESPTKATDETNQDSTATKKGGAKGGKKKPEPAPEPDKVVRQHQGGNQQVELYGRRYHLKDGDTTASIPKNDPVGDRLQAEVDTAASKWSDNELSANERAAIRQAYAKGEGWRANLLRQQAFGRFVHAAVRLIAPKISPTLEYNPTGVDLVDTKTGLNYEVLSGTETNADLHAKRMADITYRMLQFWMP
ncbi:MAG: DUF4157 domain-containing protein [Thermomicrobiales bacterium]